MLGLCKDAKHPKLLVKLLHKCLNTRFYRAEIVILKLLSLWGLCSEKSPSRENEIAALFIKLLVDEEIFLLCADGGLNAGNVLVSKKLKNAESLLVDHLHRAKQGSFFVKRLAAVRAEGSGNAERGVLYERVRGGVPSRVAPCLKGGAQAARGEGRSVGFTLNKLLSREFHNYLSVGGRRYKAVVLFGGDARHRLEPVRVMSRALFDRPIFHCVGNSVSDIKVETATVLDGPAQSKVGVYYI